MLHEGLSTELPVPVIVQDLSPGRNPDPETLMKVPTCPDDGINVIEGPLVTFRVASAKSPVFAVARITYNPGATFPTTKLPFTIPVPALILHAGVTTTLLRDGLVIVHVVAANE